jgi:hypothetical protein
MEDIVIYADATPLAKGTRRTAQMVEKLQRLSERFGAFAQPSSISENHLFEDNRRNGSNIEAKV